MNNIYSRQFAPSAFPADYSGSMRAPKKEYGVFDGSDDRENKEEDSEKSQARNDRSERSDRPRSGISSRSPRSDRYIPQKERGYYENYYDDDNNNNGDDAGVGGEGGVGGGRDYSTYFSDSERRPRRPVYTDEHCKKRLDSGRDRDRDRDTDTDDAQKDVQRSRRQPLLSSLFGNSGGGALSKLNFSLEDIVLAGIILLLLSGKKDDTSGNCDDELLLILGFLLIVGL